MEYGSTYQTEQPPTQPPSYRSEYQPILPTENNRATYALPKVNYRALVEEQEFYPVPQGAYAFTYEHPVLRYRYQVVLSKTQITVEYQSYRHREISSSFLYNLQHITGFRLKKRRVFVYDLPIALSFLYQMLLLLSLVLVWISVSTRILGLYQLTGILGIIQFIFIILGVWYVRGTYLHRYFDPPMEVGPPYLPFASVMYWISVLLSIGIAVCSIGGLSMSGSSGSYYWYYVDCNEQNWNGGGHTFEGYCDNSFFAWVQATASFLLVSFVITTIAHLSYFGKYCPFYILDIRDPENQPTMLTFHGTLDSGFPYTAILAKKDSDKLITLFYELFDRTLAPNRKVSITSSRGWAWLSLPGIEFRRGYNGQFI